MATDSLYGKLNASELSAILLLKGSSMSTDRDAGFCSGSSETGDDLSMDNSRTEPRSPTDASEDSVEVKVMPISFAKNKRKSTEPSRVVCEKTVGPLKKRIRYTPGESVSETVRKHHFRPWDNGQVVNNVSPNPAEVLTRHPGVTTLHRPRSTPDDIEVQDQPLALVIKKQHSSSTDDDESMTNNCTRSKSSSSEKSRSNSESRKCQTPSKNDTSTIDQRHKKFRLSRQNDDSESVKTTADMEIPSTIENNRSPSVSSIPQVPVSLGSCSNSSNCSVSSQRPQQRNYKNMTRERRIEANARERTRVHTISAAYETLRQAIPSYSNTQRLSKLSVLRVACSYILSLSRMAGYDYSEDQSAPSISECVAMVTSTIQTEGKVRKKKDD